MGLSHCRLHDAHIAVRVLRPAALLLGVLAATVACGNGRPAPPARPNILLYLIDTLRADSLGCYGNPVVETPNLDVLASEGMLFEQAFAPSSWTRASMASIFTGLAASAHGVETRDAALGASVDHLSERLRQAGYRTGFINTNPNVGTAFGFERGFDDMIELYARRQAGYVSSMELVTTGEQVAERAAAWIAAAPEPFFLAVLSIDPHGPYTPPPAFDRYGGDYQGSVSAENPRLPGDSDSPADRKRLRSLYDGEVAYADAALGKLVVQLRGSGILDRTVTLVSSDHGEEFWEQGTRGHGKNLYDPTLRVPLILRYPPRIEGGQHISRLVRSVDIVPTLLELAGLPIPDDLDGHSLLAAAAGRLDGEDAGEVFASLRLDGHDLYALRNAEWKLVWESRADRYQLFDPNAADGESRDVIAQHPERAAQLRSRLQQHLRRSRTHVERIQGGAAAPRVSPHEVSESERRLLRELGYLDGDVVD